MKALIKYLPDPTGYTHLTCFAVTRNVKEDDSAYNKEHNHFHSGTKGCNKMGCLKILGTISSNAFHFVEDGKEYEMELSDYNERLRENFEKAEGRKLIGMRIYEVKCPTCKHYH